MNSNFKLGFLLTLVVLTFNTASVAPTVSATEVLNLINQDRQNEGLSPLELDPTLNLAAFAKAEDMLSKKYFNHIGPDGTEPWDFLKIFGYKYSYAGENLAMGFMDAEELEKSWMSSPTHRANILSPNFSDVGLAIVERDNTTLVVQFFGSKDSKLTFTAGH